MEQKISTAVLVMAALVIIAAGTIILAVQSSRETVLPGQPDTLTLSTIPTRASPRITTPADKHATVTTTATITITARFPKKGVNECIMGPEDYAFQYYNTTVFTAVSEADYSSPVGRKDPGITIEQAKDIALKAVPLYSPSRVEMNFTDGTVNVRAWNFVLYKDDQQVVGGNLYADTGDLMSYSVNPWVMAEQGNSNPATAIDSARVTAENEIRERNGEIPVKLVNSWVDRNGNFAFSFRRNIRGVPCFNDGISITIDSGTGKIRSYSKSWYLPENAVAAQSVPAITRDAAIALVEREAKTCHPESADSFRIISANLQWMDLYHPDQFTPKPGVIPLAWGVWFDDKTIRGSEFPVPGEGWVDAQNGTLLSLNYYHHD